MKRRDAAPEAKRLLALAAPGEALVTAPARGLLADAGLVLQPRGLHRTALESRERH